jgi:POT family proton-dependent oligopeptide transporter
MLSIAYPILGGFKAIMATFIADQYTSSTPQIKILHTGEQVITDYELTLQHIYGLYFWIGNVGSLSWFGTVYIEEHYGFAWAYGLTLCFMVVATLLLLFGKHWYMKASHKDNVIVPQAAKIVACAVRNGCRMNHAYPDYQLEHQQKVVSWTGSMVDELTRGLRACRVLLAFVVFYVCFDQMQNNLISQAGQMKTNGTPNDLLPAMNQVGCIIIGPLVQWVLYPFLHRRGIYIGPIMRITIGFGFVALSMLYATIVQHAIYNSPPCYTQPANCSSPGMDFNRPNVWIKRRSTF